MNKKLIAAAVSAAMLLPVAAVAQVDAEFYGSIRAGVVSGDDDTADSSNQLDLGATENDGSINGQGLYSRVGFRGSTDLGGGMSAGFRVERGVGSGALTTRHTNVWLAGNAGKLTLGQQDNPYRNARHWDQTWYLGGQFGFNDGGSRIEGIRYDLSSGPFSLALMATGNDDQAADSMPMAGTEQGDSTNGATGTGTAGVEHDDGIDSFIIAAGYDFGVVNLNVAHRTDNRDVEVATLATNGTPTAANIAAANLETTQAIDLAGRVSDNTVIGLNGSVGQFGWYLAYQSSADNIDGADSDLENDVDSIGGFVSLSPSDNDTLYLYHVAHSADRATWGEDDDGTTVVALGEDPSETILGYSRSIGSGVTFIGEYLDIDKDLPSGTDGDNPTTLVLTLKVDF